jgi:hypothetical protein
VLRFTLHSGSDLMPADRNGFSDPYCIIRVNSAPIWRSKKCFRTLNPVWEQTHEFQGYLTDLVRKPVKIRVYDWDMVSLNDPIGRCHVDISALSGYGVEHGLTFKDVALTGVPHGSISFSLHFELKPVFALFPGTPVHASAAQALRRRPPPDASRLELMRDGLLRLLGRKLFLYIAVLWLTSLVSTIVFIVVLYAAIFIPVFMDAGTPLPPNETLSYAGWSREARFIGLSDDELMFWCNVCFQVCTGLFSYLNGISIPWRSSILIHHISGRDSSPGRDFYGRPTEAIWFHIPERPRSWIAIFLCLSVFFHFATQVTRIVWSDYITSNDMPGIIPVNATFLLSIIFAVAAGVLQGHQEKKLMKANPERFPPGISKDIKEFLRKARRGEVRLCSLSAFRDVLRSAREEASMQHVKREATRMEREFDEKSTRSEAIKSGRLSGVLPPSPSDAGAAPSPSSPTIAPASSSVAS